MRLYADVFAMWCQYDDRELLDWQWTYERVLRKDPHCQHAEHLLQDLAALNQLLSDRNLK
jgi:hypothetical protein